MAEVGSEVECVGMYKHILMPVDLDEPSTWKQAMAIVEAMAQCFSARITICTVATTREALETGEIWPISYQDKLAAKHAELDSIAAHFTGRARPGVEVGIGGIPSGIVDIAERIGADLIALSSHQHELADFLISSKAARVSSIARCSVLVIRSSTDKPGS